MLLVQNNVDYVPLARTSYSSEVSSQRDEFGATDANLSCLGFKDGEYRFLRNIAVQGICNFSEGWLCWSRDLGASFIGKGDAFVSAFEDFKNQLHTIFQRLYRMRPFEMSDQEQEQWRKLVNLIDVHHYRTTTPLVVREVGQVSYGQISRPYRIKWLSGNNYIIDRNSVPENLMALKPGRYIEAVVKRDPVTHKEIEILSVQPISFHLPTDKQAKEYWDKMPVAKLPEGRWD